MSSVGRWLERAGPPSVGVLAALAYGLTGEVVFQNIDDWLRGTLCLSFLVVLPVGIGALTAALAPAGQRSSWPYAVFAPWAVCTLLGIVVAVVALELWACVVMALPIFFLMSSVGGILMFWWRDRRQRRAGDRLLSLLLLAPFLLGPLEAQWQLPMVERAVETSVVVDATPQQVWDTFVAVPAIRRDEQGFAWFRLLGLPNPVAATLSKPGVDGMRAASYDNGLRVWEPVREWQPYVRYRFDVQVDPASLPSPLWGAVESDYLDVQYVEYRIEPLDDAQVRVVLATDYRLTTPLNPYASLWVDFLLRDFQHTILRVMAERAERL